MAESDKRDVDGSFPVHKKDRDGGVGGGHKRGTGNSKVRIMDNSHSSTKNSKQKYKGNYDEDEDDYRSALTENTTTTQNRRAVDKILEEDDDDNNSLDSLDAAMGRRGEHIPTNRRNDHRTNDDDDNSGTKNHLENSKNIEKDINTSLTNNVDNNEVTNVKSFANNIPFDRFITGDNNEECTVTAVPNSESGISQQYNVANQLYEEKVQDNSEGKWREGSNEQSHNDSQKQVSDKRRISSSLPTSHQRDEIQYSQIERQVSDKQRISSPLPTSHKINEIQYSQIQRPATAQLPFVTSDIDRIGRESRNIGMVKKVGMLNNSLENAFSSSSDDSTVDEDNHKDSLKPYNNTNTCNSSDSSINSDRSGSTNDSNSSGTSYNSQNNSNNSSSGSSTIVNDDNVGTTVNRITNESGKQSEFDRALTDVTSKGRHCSSAIDTSLSKNGVVSTMSNCIVSTKDAKQESAIDEVLTNVEGEQEIEATISSSPKNELEIESNIFSKKKSYFM